MAIQACQLLPLLCFSLLGSAFWRWPRSEESFSRRNFPADFLFGTASSAYQIEGAVDEGGRGPSIWDTFVQQRSDKIADGSNARVAIDFYHRYKEDVRTMKELGIDAYRLSISWSRILPNGKLSGGINEEGVQYYNNVINELKSNGLEPFVTIFHWDLPQALEDQYEGFLSTRIVEDFNNYADVCFRLFGDRVKYWMTLNEPLTFSTSGYSTGRFPPGRCSPWQDAKCRGGDSGHEPYIVAHHLLLAHAAAVKLYRDNYLASQKGKIGIALDSYWFLPYSDTASDEEAVTRAFDFSMGWFMEPLTQGSYPFKMKELVQDRLPQFTPEQSEMLKGSFDFLALSYYTSNYAKFISRRNANISFELDAQIITTGICDGIPIGTAAASDWIFMYPRGLREVLLYVHGKYNNPVIYIAENGYDDFSNVTLEKSFKDDIRIEYLKQHLESIEMAIREGVNVKGYFAWSLFDNFEWTYGYTVRFGLYYVDFKSLQRYPKSSALWFRKFLER